MNTEHPKPHRFAVIRCNVALGSASIVATRRLKSEAQEECNRQSSLNDNPDVRFTVSTHTGRNVS